MSYHREKGKGKRDQQGRSVAKGLANEMQQGNHPKHADQGKDYVGKTMTQGGRKSGSKGSACKGLGAVMQQGGSKHRG